MIENEDNIVHLKYPGCLTQDDLSELSTILTRANLELKPSNSVGKITASLDDFNLLVSIAISSPLVVELIKGLGTNAAWDIIKLAILSVRSKVLGQKVYNITARGQTEREMTIGIKMKLDKNTQYDFEIKGTEEIVDKSLDKVLDFLREQKPNSGYEHPFYVKYSNENQDWEAINVLEEMRKMRREKK